MSIPKFCLVQGKDEIQVIELMKSILVEGQSHAVNDFNDRFWNWKYKSIPLNLPQIYGVKIDNKIVGYYHIPIYDGKFENKSIKVGVIQDVAIQNNHRGGGNFKNLADFANNDIANKVDLIFTFPNNKSIHTFQKYNNYKIVSVFDSYILPLKLDLIIKSKINLFGFEKIVNYLYKAYTKIFRLKSPNNKELVLENFLTEKDNLLIQKFNNKFNIGVKRSNLYYNWRLLEKPNSENYVFKVKSDTETVAILFFKAELLFNNPTLVLMDFVYGSDPANLLYALEQIKNDKNIVNKFNLIFVTGLFNELSSFRKVGFLKIPNYFNPRPLNFLVKTFNVGLQNKEITNLKNWHVSLCDWDVL